LPIYIILSTLAMAVGLYLAWLVHGRNLLGIVVDPGAGQLESVPAEEFPLISIIVPARNEARNIRHNIQLLLEQTYPNYELIVVDDRSTDGTSEILHELGEVHPRLRVVGGAELPEGWAGKPHALVQGVQAARGEWLCFIDADTFAHPRLLSSAYHQALKSGADLFSIFTEQELGSFWERVVLPLVFLGLSFGFPPERVNDPAKPDAIANGQFILIKRQVYEKVGGHTAVKGHIDEDKAIATLVKGAGFCLVLADGRRVASTRMYTSLPEMWEGWTKNIYLGLLDRLWLLFFGALLGLFVAILLPLWLAGGIYWLTVGGNLPALVVTSEAIILWAYLVWKRVGACRRFHIPLWYAFTFPLGAFIFTAMMMASAYNVISGRGVHWKGRRYR